MSFPFNIIIIGGLLCGVKSIYTFGLITTIGWASQFLFLLPSVKKSGYSLYTKEKNDIDYSALKSNEIAFIFISNVIFSFMFMLDKSFASHTESASSSIHYASNLFTTISSVFVVGMSAVFFPSLTKSLSEKNDEKTASLVRFALIFMFSIFVPFLMITSIYNKDIIRLVYERGSFDNEATEFVSKAFFRYAFCIFGYITQELLFKVFYAKGRYKVTVISSLSIIVINIICNFIFRNNIDMIITSTPVICILFSLFIFILLGNELKSLFNRTFFINILKICVSALPFVLCCFIFGTSDSNKLYFVVPIVVSAILYFILLYLFKIVQLIFNKES